MSSGIFAHSRFVPRSLAAVAVAFLLSWPASSARGQLVQNAVGGVSISADGVVGEPNAAEREALLDELRRDATKVPDDLGKLVELRKISLRGLEAAIEEARKNPGAKLPDEVKYLGGLLRIRYVFLYPESNDIVLAGPGEGWKMNGSGIPVGVTTGRPVLLLDDLLQALRAVSQASGAISCSIDPTEQGLRTYQALCDKLGRLGGQLDPRRFEADFQRALGPQKITLTGVPADTHFARVLVSADYRMKRLAMDLEEAPIKGLPSFVDLMKSGRSSSAGKNSINPRWWLACDYQPLARSDDGLAWELRGPGVKVVTEDDFVTPDGKIQATGRNNALAQKWADLMNAQYNELSLKDSVFGQLRNLMDMCVVATLIDEYELAAKAGCSLPLLTGAADELATAGWNSPKTVATQCSFTRIRNRWIVTASGGVHIDSWSVAARTEVNRQIEQARSQAAASGGKSWRWN